MLVSICPTQSRVIAHKFDRYLLIVQEVSALKYHAKRALSYLLANPIMDPDHVRGRGRHMVDLVVEI